MDTIPDEAPMENPLHPPLAGLDPADLLKQGVAADTFMDDATPFNPPPVDELASQFPQFEILGLIGKGGMGAVYKVRQKELDRIVALKILPPAIGETPGFSDRFAHEAKALAKLNHPGIVTLHEFGQRDGLYFILMEFVDGVNLGQLMQTGRISPREALAIVPQICDALQFAHDQGIVHRDIKPENILLDRLGRVKVADFGIAKVVSASCDCLETAEQQRSQTDATLAEKIIGTPQYMAPEQIDHPAAVDHRADIYALGVVFYQMLTGELPGKRIEAPSKKVHIDVRLDEIVLRALEKDPELRYPQVSMMKTQVESCAENFTQLETSLSKIATTQTAFDRFSSDGGNWYFYFIYFNREDPRMIVPKRMVGWTINFAQPLAIPLLAAISLATLGLLEVAHRLGVTGHSMLGVKFAILVAVVWLCHSLSTARRKPLSGSIRHSARAWHSHNSRWVACFVWAVVGLCWYGFIFGIPHEMKASFTQRPSVAEHPESGNLQADASDTERLLDLEIAVHLARKMYHTSEPAFKQAAMAFDEFIRANPSARGDNYGEALDQRRNLLITRSKELAGRHGPQHLEVVGNRHELEAAEQIIRTRMYLVTRTPDVSQSGQMKFHFDCAGDTMQKVLSRLGRQFDVRICWEHDEKIFTSRTEPVLSKDLLEELEIEEASGRLSDREKERLAELRRFPESGGGETFTRYQGELTASSLKGLLDQLTKNTTDRARKSKSGKTWIISPIEASRLEFPVTMNTCDWTVRQAVNELCSQSPDKLERTSFGERPWLDMACKPVSFDHEPAWEVLCRISEDAEFDLIWEAIPDLVINPSHSSVDGYFAHAAKAVTVSSSDKRLQLQDSQDAANELLTLLVEVGLAKAGGMENSNPSMIEMENKVARFKNVIKERMLVTPNITIAKVASERLSDCKKKQAGFHDGGLDSLHPVMKRLKEEMEVLGKIIAEDDKSESEPTR